MLIKKGYIKKDPVKWKHSNSFVLAPLPELSKEEWYELKHADDEIDSGSYLDEEERKKMG